MSRFEFSAVVRRTGRVAGGQQRTLDLASGRERVPAIWLTPAGDAPAPAVLLLHGFSSSKERMSQAIGRALLARGVGSLALDLPFHGERAGADRELPRNPLALVAAWKTAVAETRAAAAAVEPKTMVWYDGGHWPGPLVIDETAGWVADRLREVGKTGVRRMA